MNAFPIGCYIMCYLFSFSGIIAICWFIRHLDKIIKIELKEHKDE